MNSVNDTTEPLDYATSAEIARDRGSLIEPGTIRFERRLRSVMRNSALVSVRSLPE